MNDAGPGDGDGDMTPDAGGDGDAPDGGSGEDAGPVVMCPGSDDPCVDLKPGLLTLPGCCDQRPGSAAACGGLVAIPDTVTPLDGCHAQNQPGDPSEYCGAFFDAIEGPGGMANGAFDVDLLGNPLALAGCCSDTGFCGVVVNEFVAANMTIAPMFGCIPVDHFVSMMATAGDGGVGDAGTPPEVDPPFCQPANEMGATCPPRMTVRLPGRETIDICAQLAEKLPVIGCQPEGRTPDWFCALRTEDTPNGLTSTETGTVPVLVPGEDTMEYLPEFLSGCGDTPGAGCVPGVAQGVFGAVDVDMLTAEQQAPLLALLPETACGCGDGMVAQGCIPNIDGALCGTRPVEAGDPILTQYPKFQCGCEGSNATELGCLRGVPSTVCGSKDETEFLGLVPTFVCGCGDEPATRDSGFASLCMSNVDRETCGTKNTPRVDREPLGEEDPNDCLEGLPEFARGCGEDTEPSAANPTCLRDTLALFGCNNVPSEAPAIPRVPEYLCGCGEDVPYTGEGLPCLSFVGNNSTSNNPICGATPITSTAQVLPVIPNRVCGCGEGTQGEACLDNVPDTVCGPVARCQEGAAGSGEGSPTTCAEGQVCADVTGAGGSVGDPVGDDIGDSCATPPP